MAMVLDSAFGLARTTCPELVEGYSSSVMSVVNEVEKNPEEI